jgi:hypothetical protein
LFTNKTQSLYKFTECWWSFLVSQPIKPTATIQLCLWLTEGQLFYLSIPISPPMKLDSHYTMFTKMLVVFSKCSGFTANKTNKTVVIQLCQWLTGLVFTEHFYFITNKTDNYYTSLPRWWWFSPGIPVSQPIKQPVTI